MCDEDNQSSSQVISVPFSWELKPGVSKASTHQDFNLEVWLNLPPPPCPQKKPQALANGSSFRAASRKGLHKQLKLEIQDDPFEIAHRKCAGQVLSSGNGGLKLKKKMLVSLSCRYSSAVSEDNLVRIIRNA